MANSTTERELQRRWQRIDAKLNKKKRKTTGPWDHRIAVACEMRSHFQARYGDALPDDDAGREDAGLMLWYLAHGPHREVKMAEFLRDWCPWMQPHEREAFMFEARTSRPPCLTGDQIAQRLGVTYEQRQKLGFRQIGAIDADKAARKRFKRERDREPARLRSQNARRARGARPRAEALSQTRPWEAEGKSRRTWERHRSRVANSFADKVKLPMGERICDSAVAASPKRGRSASLPQVSLRDESRLCHASASAQRSRSGQKAAALVGRGLGPPTKASTNGADLTIGVCVTKNVSVSVYGLH